MQQPPQGRPQPGSNPYPYPPQRPPVGYAPPQPAAPQLPATPPARPRKSRAALRFLASTCVVSAWLTLVAAIIGAGFSFVSAAAMAGTAAAAGRSQQYFPMPGSPGLPGGSPLDPTGGLLGEGGGMPSMPAGPFTGISGLQGLMSPVLMASGIITLVTGLVTFLLFLGLGQAFYALIDLEEQQHRIESMVGTIMMRLGTR